MQHRHTTGYIKCKHTPCPSLRLQNPSGNPSKDTFFKMSGVVFDNGSGLTKAGAAGDSAPKVVFSTAVAATPDEKECYVGEKAQAKRDLVNLTSPIEHGCVENWNGLEKVADFFFPNIGRTL